MPGINTLYRHVKSGSISQTAILLIRKRKRLRVKVNYNTETATDKDDNSDP